MKLQVLLLLDVDFMVSSSLNEVQHTSWLQSAVSQGMLVVLPALEPIKSDAAAQQSVLKTCQGEQGFDKSVNAKSCACPFPSECA